MRGYIGVTALAGKVSIVRPASVVNHIRRILSPAAKVIVIGTVTIACPATDPCLLTTAMLEFESVTSTQPEPVF